MSKKTIRDKLDIMSEQDAYTFMMFALYEMQNIEEYKTISTLMYLLNKEDFLKIVRCLGGSKITLPTIEDVKVLAQCLLLVKYITVNKFSSGPALNRVGITKEDKAWKMYKKVEELLDKYNFNEGEELRW